MRKSPCRTPPLTPSIVLDGDGDDEVELARLRELEETELLVLIEESDRENELAAEFAAANKRKAGSDALFVRGPCREDEDLAGAT